MILDQKQLLRDKPRRAQTAQYNISSLILSPTLSLLQGRKQTLPGTPKPQQPHTPGLTLLPPVSTPAVSHPISFSSQSHPDGEWGWHCLGILQMKRLRPKNVMRLSQRSHSQSQSAAIFQILLILLQCTTLHFKISQAGWGQRWLPLPQQVQGHPLASKGISFLSGTNRTVG